jgi:hypothetical protein
LRCAGTRCLWAASTASGKVTRVKIDSKWIAPRPPRSDLVDQERGDGDREHEQYPYPPD